MASPVLDRTRKVAALRFASIARGQFVRKNSCRHVEGCHRGGRGRVAPRSNRVGAGRRRARRCVAGVRLKAASCENGSQQRCSGHHDGDGASTRRGRPAARQGVCFHGPAPSTRPRGKCLARRRRGQASTGNAVISFADRCKGGRAIRRGQCPEPRRTGAFPPQRPLNFGVRFSRNAATPSRWSAVPLVRRCVSASRSSSAS
jgi:hypothetical protein